MAKDICKKYNYFASSDLENRMKLIRELFYKTGKMFTIEQSFWCDYGYNISIGENFYMNHNCVILDCTKVEFGDNVTTVGAGSVVVKDIPSKVVAVGNPCRVVKELT